MNRIHVGTFLILFFLGLSAMALLSPGIFGFRSYNVPGSGSGLHPRGVVESASTTRVNTLVVPALNITAPVVYVSTSTEEAFQAALEKGVGHYPGTAMPGQPGNCYVFGHSSDMPFNRGEYKDIFANLPDIKKGDEARITDQDGKEYVYIVSETKVVEENDFSVLQQDLTKNVLTLQTSYPVGTAFKRFVAIAELK